jgi:hypothetical protein
MLFLVFALMLPSAWIVRDYEQFNTVVPISINPQASLYTDNVDPIGGSGYAADVAPAQCPRDVLYSQDLQQHFAWGRCMARAGLSEITDHPADSALAVPDRLVALFTPWNPTFARGTYSSDHWGYQRLVPASLHSNATYKNAERVLVIALMVLYVLMMIVGLWGMWLEGAGSVARVIALPVIVLPLVHLMFHAENRFRVPLLPLIAIAITLGVLSTWDTLIASRRK